MTTESNCSNTWASYRAAERDAVAREDLNPGMVFEIVDLDSGEVVCFD